MTRLSIIHKLIITLSVLSITSAFVVPSQYGLVQRIEAANSVVDNREELRKVINSCDIGVGYCHSFG